MYVYTYILLYAHYETETRLMGSGKMSDELIHSEYKSISKNKLTRKKLWCKKKN